MNTVIIDAIIDNYKFASIIHSFVMDVCCVYRMCSAGWLNQQKHELFSQAVKFQRFVQCSPFTMLNVGTL